MRGRRPVPRAPWGAFPLSELCVLGGIVLSVAGFLSMSARGALLAACGLTLALLAGAELSRRRPYDWRRAMTSPAAPALAPEPPLSRRAKAVLATEIVVAYARVRARLARGNFRDAVGGLRAVAPSKPAPGDPVRAGRRLGRAVVRTLRILPTDSRCLMRSLVLTRLLARRDVPSTLVIGVRKDDELAAHAWVEHEGVPLLDPGDPGYTRLVEL
jgi:hypothetical protein